MELSPLKRQRASDEVYQALRDGILARLFKPGQRLQMNELADQLGVSMTPVRQAIQHLATEGLIEIRPRSGTFIARLDARDVEETFAIRTALECLAGEEALTRITQAQLDEFRRILANLAKSVKTEEARKRHERDNTKFHRHLMECSGNRRLIDMYGSLNAHLQIARLHARESGWDSRLELEQAEHEEIVAALEARKEDRLRKAIRSHIQRAKNSMLAAITS